MKPWIRILTLVCWIGHAGLGQAQSDSLAWPQGNFLDRWLLHTRLRPRVATVELQLRNDKTQVGQILLANREGFAWQPGDSLPPSAQNWQWVRPETIQRLKLKRSIPFGTHLRRTSRMTLYGIWGINALAASQIEYEGYWYNSLGLYSHIGGLVGFGVGLATALITEMTTWSRYRFNPETAEAAISRYPSIWWGLRHVSLYRAEDSTLLGEPPLWEMRRAEKRWSVVLEAGHMIDFEDIGYYNDRSLAFTAVDGSSDKEWIRTGPYYARTRWYTLSLGYMLHPAWQIGLRYAFPMEANAPWSTLNPPLEGNVSWSVQRGSQIGIWSAVDVLPPEVFPLLRTRVQVGGGYFFQPLTVEQSISIEERVSDTFPYERDVWNLYAERQTRRWLHGLEGFIRVRQELNGHLALTATLRRHWIPQRTQVDPLTLDVPPELDFPVEQFIFSPHALQHGATLLTPGIEVRW